MAFLYSLYCYAWFLKGLWLALAALVLASGVVTQTALAWRSDHERSLCIDREAPAEAISEGDYRLLGERRPGAFD